MGYYENKNVAQWYNSKYWQHTIKTFKLENPYCVFCGSTNYLIADHIIPHKGNKELFFDVANLQTLCRKCHNTTKLKMELKNKQLYRNMNLDNFINANYQAQKDR